MESNTEVQAAPSKAKTVDEILPVKCDPYIGEHVTLIDKDLPKPVPAIIHDVHGRDSHGHPRICVNGFTDAGVLVRHNIRLFNPPLNGPLHNIHSYAVRPLSADIDISCELPIDEQIQGKQLDGVYDLSAGCGRVVPVTSEDAPVCGRGQPASKEPAAEAPQTEAEAPSVDESQAGEA